MATLSASISTPRELLDFCWIRLWRKALFQVFAVFFTLALNLLWNNRASKMSELLISLDLRGLVSGRGPVYSGSCHYRLRLAVMLRASDKMAVEKWSEFAFAR